MALGVVKAFLSQPYGKTQEERLYWETFQSGIDQLANLFSNPSLEIYSAGKTVSDLVLKQNVKNLIDSCDFTIAVITGSNPNVFWEIGYTEAQGKPVVFLMDEDGDDVTRSPVLVIEALKCSYRSSMLSTLVTERKLPEDFTQRLKPFLEQAISVAIARRVKPIATIISNRDACHLADLISKADARIYLITMNLNYFADFDKFVVERSEKIYALDSPAERGVDVRIMTLTPTALSSSTELNNWAWSTMYPCFGSSCGLAHIDFTRGTRIRKILALEFMTNCLCR